MKDWTGNKKSTFATLGRSNHSSYERAEDDFYSTDPQALEVFLQALKRDGIILNNTVWECACGNGALSEVLYSHGYDVISSDKVFRGYQKTDFCADFLKWQGKFKVDADILTNPPFKYAKEFVEKGLEYVEAGNKVIMLLRIQFLEGQKRREMFDKTPPKYVYVNSARVQCFINGEVKENMSSAACYCWFIWEKGYTGETILRWI